MPELTDEKVDQRKAGIRKVMAYELLEMCQVIEPTAVFGSEIITKPGDFQQVFQFIDAMRNGLDDDAFMEFYKTATAKGKHFYERGMATEPGSEERVRQAEMTKFCEEAFSKLTETEIQALQKMNFPKVMSELDEKLNDGSLACSGENVLGFIRQAIQLYSK